MRHDRPFPAQRGRAAKASREGFRLCTEAAIRTECAGSCIRRRRRSGDSEPSSRSAEGELILATRPRMNFLRVSSGSMDTVSSGKTKGANTVWPS